MDFFTSTILSGIAYDVIKCGVLMTTDNLKDRLEIGLLMMMRYRCLPGNSIN